MDKSKKTKKINKREALSNALRNNLLRRKQKQRQKKDTEVAKD